MIAALQRNDVPPTRLSSGMPIEADEFDGAIDRIGSTKPEINVIETARREIRECRRKTNGRLAREMEIARRIRQLAHLFGRGFDNAVLPVADIDTPKSGKAIEMIPAFSITEVTSARFGQ